MWSCNPPWQSRLQKNAGGFAVFRRKSGRLGEQRSVIHLSHPFLIGAAGYPLIELCWRRRTHPAMALAGGVSMKLLSILHRTQKGRPLWQNALLGGLMITGVEYAIGRRLNRRYQIWDYRRTPLNVQGQICLPYTLAWCGLSAAACAAMRAMDHSSRSRISAM